MKKQKKTAFTAIALIAFLGLGYILWVSYANKKVREVVDQSLARMEERLEQNGNDVTISYDDVKVHGISLRPHASVYKLHMKIEDERGRELHISLPEIVYIPNSFNMRSYTMEVLDSVTLITDGEGVQQSSLVEFSESPQLHVDEQAGGKLHYSLRVPMHITMTDGADEADVASAAKTDIAFETRPVVEWMLRKDGLPLDQKLQLGKTTLSFEGDTLAELAGLNIDTRYSEAEGGLHRYANTAKLDSLNFAEGDLEVLNPINIANDVTYTGPVSVTGAEAVSGPQHFVFKNIAFTTGLSSLFINGEVHFDDTREKIPYGNLTVRLDDVDAALNHIRTLRPKTAAFLANIRKALESFSGVTLEEGGSATVEIVRKPNERLYVGKLTLEESLGVFIEMVMSAPDFSEDRNAPAPAAEPQPQVGTDSGEVSIEVTDEQGEVLPQENIEIEQKPLTEGMDDLPPPADEGLAPPAAMQEQIPSVPVE